MGRKKYSKELKAQIALDAIKGQKTIAELASVYGVHANQISIWNKQLLDADPAAFSNGKDKDAEKKEVSETICIKRLAIKFFQIRFCHQRILAHISKVATLIAIRSIDYF